MHQIQVWDVYLPYEQSKHVFLILNQGFHLVNQAIGKCDQILTSKLLEG
jgi:hypothetical protein